MRIQCNRRGGFNLKVPTESGFETLKLAHGINDVDGDMMTDAMAALPEAMAKAITAKKPGSKRPPDLELLADDGEPEGADMKAVDKVKLVRAAETLEELRELAEGEDRQTVLTAIEKRAAQLQE
jgi:hypothetical protein